MPPQEFQELIPLAKTLNEESDQMNATIEALNKKLESLNLGLEVWLGPWANDPCQIGYAKIESYRDPKWELATRRAKPIRSGTDDYGEPIWEPDPDSIEPPESLLKASRNTRVTALGLLPGILDKLGTAAEQSVDSLKRARKIVDEL